VEPAWRDAQGETERRLWSAVLRPAAVELDDHAAELSRAVVPYISERMPDLIGSAEAWEVRRASNEASIRGFAKVLQSGADPADAATLGSATLALVRDGAKRGVPVSALLRSYRLAHAGVARQLYAILANHAADAKELSLAIDLCSAWMFAYVDAAVCLAEDLYTSEREHWLRSAAASEVETINTILSEQPIDIDVASRRLRYEVRRVHVAAIAWIDTHEQGRDTLALLEAAISDIAAAFGNQRPLIQPLGILSIAAWISTNAAVPSKLLDELRFHNATAPGVRVAIGEQSPGIAGFRTSHIEALEAHRIARLAGSREGSITRYHDIALCAQATANIEHSRRSCNGSWAAWRRGMTPPAGWPRRCAPTSMRTAAAGAPRNDSTSTRTPSPTGSAKPRSCWEGRWKSAPLNCASRSPWPIWSTTQRTRTAPRPPATSNTTSPAR
jgi:hypothetical protein